MRRRSWATVLFIAGVAAIVASALVAGQIRASRIELARTTVERLATEFRTHGNPDAAGGSMLRPDELLLLTGPGRMSVFAPTVGWPVDRVVQITDPVRDSASKTIPSEGNAITSWHPDPWGNQYLVITGAVGSGVSIVVLSPGPNGIVETSLRGAVSPAGDDIIATR